MHLSHDQMTAVMHGVEKTKEAWEPIQLGEISTTPKPDWLIATHVNWMEGYGNSPAIQIKANYHLTDWDGREFERRAKGLWIAESLDGRCVAHYHNGGLSATGELVEGRKLYITPKQGGYDGRPFRIPMKDGTMVDLIGPWHGAAPNGYSEVTWVVWDEETANSKWAQEREWFNTGGTFGACIKTPLLLSLVSQEHPDISFATVHRSWGTHVEPYLSAWGKPKTFAYDDERMRAVRKQPAGKTYRLYWGARVPTYGIEGS